MKSFLVDFIEKHADNWLADLNIERPDILVKLDPVSRLAIFNYDIGADFFNPLVQEARGIIIDVSDPVAPKVVCWPFRKFGKYNEPYADAIDWDHCQVQEKLDGSIMKLWYNHRAQEWWVSTNSMIDAAGANLSQESGGDYLTLFKSADNYLDIHFTQLNPDYTYIFELTSPFNQVVIPQKITQLWHIGTRNNLTGEELNEDIGIQKPKLYDCHSLDECIRCVTDDLNKSCGQKIDHVEHEGFVVVDQDWHRIKVKSPIYLQLHTITSSNSVTKKSILGMLLQDALDVPALCSDFPHLAHYIKYYDFRVTEFMNRATAFMNITLRLNTLLNGDRKAVALRIKSHKFQGLGFYALNHPEMTPREIIDEMGVHKISKLIPDYDLENFGYLFDGIGQTTPEE